jgi:hypothetical protein
MAGCFYDMDRSETFRRTWPNQKEYVDMKWAHFVPAVREVYSELLGRPSISPEQKEEIYEALIDQADKIISGGAHSPIPIFKDTSAYFGDRRENVQTRETYGAHARSLSQKLRTTTALSMLSAKR